MATTPYNSLPYPVATDAPYVHLDLKNLAEAVDERLYIASATAPPHRGGRRWFKTDTGQHFLSDGTTWKPVAAPLPHVRMRKTAVQARGAGGWGQISFEATADTAGEQPWTIPGDGTITVTQAGLYMFDLTASMTTAAFACQIRKVGSNDALDQSPLGTTTSQSNHAHATRKLAAGDQVIGLVYPSSAASLTVDAPTTPCFMTVTRLGD